MGLPGAVHRVHGYFLLERRLRWLFVIALSLLVVAWGCYASVDYGYVDVCYGYVHSGADCGTRTEFDFGRLKFWD